MIEVEVMRKYLAGEASPEQMQRCEAYLNDPANSAKIEETGGDSLMETLRQLHQSTPIEPLHETVNQSLVQNIRRLSESQIGNFEVHEISATASLSDPLSALDNDELHDILDPAQASDEIGRIGRFAVLQYIASGGMGLVFKAEDPNLKRWVCIKILHPRLASQPSAIARFVRESRAAARLRHDRIVTVLEVGQHRQLPFLVMQLLDGTSLRTRMKMQPALQAKQTTKIVLQVAQGLRYLHSQNLLHRDLKPENIWLTPDADAKLLDFGLAQVLDESDRLTQAGTILGTPSYMSPEQVRGKTLDARSDLFSLGVVWFEMLSGQSPFQQANIFSTMLSIAQDSLPEAVPAGRAEVPADLLSLVQHLTQKDPDQRIASAEQLITALESLPDIRPHESQSQTIDHSRLPALVRPAHPGTLDHPGTLARNRGGAGAWTGVSWMFAGAAIVALAIALFQWSDKGTLVIEADPSVIVEMADEAVVIHDPHTGKDFEVRIGQHPLPSGVYQLEFQDPGGEYFLSANLITIRRGERQIVTVRLKPPVASAIAASDAPPLVDASPADASPPLESELQAFEDPSIASGIGFNLAGLPPLSVRELKASLGLQAGQAYSPYALVQRPPVLGDMVTGSVESMFHRAGYGSGHLYQPNRDGSLFALSSRQVPNVRIRDERGQFYCFLPTQGLVQCVRWSPQANVLAVVERGEAADQVVIWKVESGQSQIIKIIPAKATDLQWFWDGSQLALQGDRPSRSEPQLPASADGEITFFDLRRDQWRPSYGIRGTLGDHPWSTNGRFFGLLNENDLEVWDLQSAKIFHKLSDVKQVQFLRLGNRMIYRTPEQWEEWDLDSFQRTRVWKIDPTWLQSIPSTSFEKLAIVGDDNQLYFQHFGALETIPADVSYLPDWLKTQPFREWSSFFWSGDDRYFVCHWAGQASVYDTAISSQKTKLDWYRIHQNLVQGSVGIERLVASNSSTVAYLKHNYDVEEPDNVFVSQALLDLGSAKSQSVPEVVGDDRSATIAISTDGKWVATVVSNSVVRDEDPASGLKYLDDLKTVKLSACDSGKVVETLKVDGVVASLQWASDSQSLVIAYVQKIPEKTVGELAVAIYRPQDQQRYQLKLGPWVLERFNLTRPKQFGSPVLIDGNRLAVPIFKPEAFFTSGYRKLARAKQDENEELIGLFDLSQGETQGALLTTIEVPTRLIGISLQQAFDLNSQFLAFVELDDPATSRSFKEKSIQILNLHNQQLHRINVSDPQFFRYELAPQHPWLVWVTKQEVRFANLEQGDDAKNQPTPLPVTGVRSAMQVHFSWHWRQPICGVAFNDTVCWRNMETGQTSTATMVDRPVAIQATSEGWLVADSARIYRFDLDGNLLSTYFDSQPLSSNDPSSMVDQAVTTEGQLLRPDQKQHLLRWQWIGDRFQSQAFGDDER